MGEWKETEHEGWAAGSAIKWIEQRADELMREWTGEVA
jgi:hypothetical protein